MIACCCFFFGVVVFSFLLPMATLYVTHTARDNHRVASSYGRWVLPLGVAFFFTTGFITFIGCLVVGLAYPAYNSIRFIYAAQVSLSLSACNVM